MKKPNTFLHQLIHSMSKSEKRYVKLFSVHGSDNYAIKLFDLIEKQKIYDEDEIKNTLKDEPFIKRFAEVKLYLQEHVLQSLAVYHRESSPDNHLRNQLTYIEMLFKKGQFNLCENILRKARKTAEELERFAMVSEINRWELELMRMKSFTEINETDFVSFFKKSGENISRLQNANDFLRMSMMFFLKRQKAGYVRNKSDAKTLADVLNSELVSDSRKALSFSALSHYYLNRFAYHYMVYEYEKAFVYINDLVNEFLNRPAFIQDKQIAYMMSLYNLAMCQLKMNDFTAIPKTIALLNELSQRVQNKESDIILRIELIVTKIELELYNLKGDFDNAIKRARPYYENIKNATLNNISEEDKINIFFQLLKACASSGDYSLAKKVLNYSMVNTDTGVRTDLHSMFRIINMIIYFDTNDEQALEFAYNSAKKYLTKRNLIYRIESIMLEFFKKHIHSGFRKDAYSKNLNDLKKSIASLRDNPYERQAFYLFDFERWLRKSNSFSKK